MVVGRATYEAAAGFLWVEDGNVRELLRTRRPTQELFVDPSPTGGLLVAPGVDLDRLARRAFAQIVDRADHHAAAAGFFRQMPQHGRPGIGAGNRGVEDLTKHRPCRSVGPVAPS